MPQEYSIFLITHGLVLRLNSVNGVEDLICSGKLFHSDNDAGMNDFLKDWVLVCSIIRLVGFLML